MVPNHSSFFEDYTILSHYSVRKVTPLVLLLLLWLSILAVAERIKREVQDLQVNAW
jgi:hypothetical protein